MSEIFIHIGLHKTGTTTLQNDIFRRFPEVKYLELEETYKEISTLVRIPSEYLNAENIKSDYIQNLNNSEGKFLITNENLSGLATLGYINRYSNIENLKKLFPNAKIILSIREQRALVSSLYLHYLKQGGLKTFDQMIGTKRGAGAYKFYLETWKYSPLIKQLHDRFGAENVLILPLELMKNDIESYLMQLSKFFGASCNSMSEAKAAGKGIPINSLKAQLFLNSIRKSNHNSGFFNISNRFTSLVQRVAGKTGLKPNQTFNFGVMVDEWKKDNQRLRDEFGIQLPENYFR